MAGYAGIALSGMPAYCGYLIAELLSSAEPDHFPKLTIDVRKNGGLKQGDVAEKFGQPEG
jgi:hypothetical protein